MMFEKIVPYCVGLLAGCKFSDRFFYRLGILIALFSQFPESAFFSLRTLRNLSYNTEIDTLQFFLF